MKMLVHRTSAGDALPFNLSDLKSHIRVNNSDDDTAITNIGETAAAKSSNSPRLHC